MNDSNTLSDPAKSLTIAQIVHEAAARLSGLGIEDELIEKAVNLCVKRMDEIAASALYEVIAEHINQLAPKQKRKARKISSDDQASS